MIQVQSKNKTDVLIRKADLHDVSALVTYFDGMSRDTRKRYAPHGFDATSLWQVINDSQNIIPYVAIDMLDDAIVGYTIIKKGFIKQDKKRLLSYGLEVDESNLCTYAPSIADQWQSNGIGNQMFQIIVQDMKNLGFTHMVLWGGVQTTNKKAILFYDKNDFRKLGEFQHNGTNQDMIKELC